MSPLRVGIIDTGVNPWHSHVGGAVDGCRIYLDAAGRVREDGDIRDLAGHGTAVAGVLRQELPQAVLYVVRVFDGQLHTYPSLVARGILRAAGEGCTVINLSLGVPAGPGAAVLEDACRAAQAHGCTLVAAIRPGEPLPLPAALPGVIGAVADAALPPGVVSPVAGEPGRYRAASRPRTLEGLPPGANLWGSSFACARVTAAWAQGLLAEDRRSFPGERTVPVSSPLERASGA